MYMMKNEATCIQRYFSIVDLMYSAQIESSVKVFFVFLLYNGKETE